MKLTCYCCGKEFEMQNKYYRYALKRNQKRFFCSCSCSVKAQGRVRKLVDSEDLRIRNLRAAERMRLKRKKEKEALRKHSLPNFTGEIELPIGLMA